MYTEEGEVPLAEVLLSMKKKEEGKTVSIDLKKADKEELGEYLATVLPNYDRTRVYPSDIKKLISWYNIRRNRSFKSVQRDRQVFFI